ncbi:MAG: FkbM family methyltransferase [Geminicoccaceae bacterium]
MRDLIDAITDCGATPEPIRITDIGAMSLGEEECWDRLVERGMATLLGFEPQAEECKRCNAQSGEGYQYLQEAVGDGEVWPFHQCRFAATSSIFEPDLAFVSQFHGLREFMEIVETSSIQTRRLDDVEAARQTDFLKLDVQGAELVVLENAMETLKHISIVQAEVSFVPLYKNQPLFADIDRFLREQGFMLHTFLGFGRRMIQPLMLDNNPNAGLRQMLWSDVVYVRPFEPALQGPRPAALLKRAILFHELYQSYDFAARALRDYDQLTGQHLTEVYLEVLDSRKAA